MKDQEIIDQLVGTCDSVASLGEEAEARFEDLDFCLFVDSQIFLCTNCGWWCTIDEEASADYDLDEWTCQQCCEENYSHG